MYRFGWVRMLETVEGFGNVSGHGELDGAGMVVPGESEATVLGAGPIGGDGVDFLEAL